LHSLHCSLLRRGSASQLSNKHHTNALLLPRLPFGPLASLCFKDSICHLSILPSKPSRAEAFAPHICHGCTPSISSQSTCGHILRNNNFGMFIKFSEFLSMSKRCPSERGSPRLWHFWQRGFPRLAKNLECRRQNTEVFRRMSKH